MDRDTAQQKILALVEKFNAQREHYEGTQSNETLYNETQCREDFISPLFAALGWDIENKEGLAPTYRSVRLENRLVGDGTSRASDYSFWIGKERVFIVEAKKPSLNLKEGKVADQAAFQLRRYGWSANLAVSIVTNFKELAIYDCTKKPHEKDKASTARLNYLSMDDYSDRQRTLGDIRPGFDYLWEVFGYENVRRGGLEKYTNTDELKKGILAVDDSFLMFLEDWRQRFATAVFRDNKELTEWELNVGVQQILDRVVFLRFAEDRDIEQIGSLSKALNTKELGGIYRNLYELFELADDKYNAGLFDMKKDTVSKNLIVENKLLANFVKGLYYPGPYDFQAMPVEILGSAYERFLGKTIRISGRSAKVEEKPEVRKAGGVYYTPQYIVDYIVENTVGKLIEDKTPKEVSKITIVDPACGSGSFLLGAYQYLLDWHRNYYTEHLPPSKGRRTDPLTPDGLLTIEEKKRILLNNIFGVDIDVIAVEFTKLSLLLKCMEGEHASVFQRLKVYHERLLPNIDGNICCGNSLIGNDFYLQNDFSFSDKEQRKINALDWHLEFADILKKDKFDIVIGNPPYGAALSDVEREYLKQKFDIGTTDTAALFLMQARKLLHSAGKVGMIIPKAFTYASNWRRVRERLLPDIENVTDCGKVWVAVKLEMCICIIQQNNNQKTFIYAKRNKENIIEKLGMGRREHCAEFDLILNGLTKQEVEIGLKIKRGGKTLNNFVENRRGAMLQSNVSNRGNLLVLAGKQISRYYMETEKVKGKIFIKHVTDEKAWIVPNSILAQNIVAHIVHPSPHIMVTACLSSELGKTENFVLLDTINQLTVKGKYEPKFILALLNSHLLSWYIYRFVYAHAIRTMHFDSTTTAKIPFPDIDLFTKDDKSKHDKIVRLVDRRLVLEHKVREVNEMSSWNVFHRQIVAIDVEINRLVYQLYGLTDEEIAIVEGDA